MALAFDSKLETEFPFQEVGCAVEAEKNLRSDHPAALHPWTGRQAIAIPENIIKCLNIPKSRAVVDPFCGSGMTGVAAKRCGVCAYLGDVNPLATLLTTAAIGFPGSWEGERLPQEVLRVGKEVARSAAKRMAKFYGDESVVAWIWARTVPSPSPEYSDVQVPLVGSFVLSKGRGVYLDPVVKGREWSFRVCKGVVPNAAEKGLHYRAGGSFKCVLSGLPIEKNYIEKELQAGHGGLRMIAVISGMRDTREYRIATSDEEALALSIKPEVKPLASIGHGRAYDQFVRYGMFQWSDLFLNRQIQAIETVIREILEYPNIKPETAAALMFAVSRMVNRNSTLCLWDPGVKQEIVHASILRDQMYMSWSFAEANPFGGATGNFEKCVEEVAVALEPCCRGAGTFPSKVVLGDVCEQPLPKAKCTFVTELPVPGVPVSDDVADFFYVWLREGLRQVWPNEFATLATPKTQRIESHEQLVKALRYMRTDQVKNRPAAFSIAVSKHDSKARTVSEMTDSIGLIADMVSAGWVVSALWPIAVADKTPTDIVIVARSKPRVSEAISRAELRTLAMNSCASFMSNLNLNGVGVCGRSVLAFGGALRALAEARTVLMSDGRECDALVVLKDVVETIENSYHYEDNLKQQEKDL